jgi:hypothetical protein
MHGVAPPGVLPVAGAGPQPAASPKAQIKIEIDHRVRRMFKSSAALCHLGACGNHEQPATQRPRHTANLPDISLIAHTRKP